MTESLVEKHNRIFGRVEIGRSRVSGRWKVCGDDVVRGYVVKVEGKMIEFSPCGVQSWNPSDVAQRYCAYCHRFVEG